nr:MAPEG family protein [Hyphomonas sp. Mor2]
MSFELQMVVGSVAILLALLVLQGTLVPLNQGFGWGLGSRDSKQELTDMQGRAGRTVANHIEGMLLFVPLVMVVELASLSSPLTVWGAGIYLVGRLAFAPLYLFGVPYLRSLVWGGALTGILLVGFEVVTAVFAS